MIKVMIKLFTLITSTLHADIFFAFIKVYQKHKPFVNQEDFQLQNIQIEIVHIFLTINPLQHYIVFIKR